MVKKSKAEKRMSILALVALLCLGIIPITLTAYIALIANGVLESTTAYWLITLSPAFIGLVIELILVIYELVKTVREGSEQ